MYIKIVNIYSFSFWCVQKIDNYIQCWKTHFLLLNIKAIVECFGDLFLVSIFTGIIKEGNWSKYIGNNLGK